MASNDIKQLDDRTHVRSRIGMYLGGSDEAGNGQVESLYTGIREALDNAIDELISGRGDTIWVNVQKAVEPLGKDKYEGKKVSCTKWFRYTVADNAGGIPIKKTKNLKDEEVTMCELAVGSLRAGSKFSKTDALVGLNGVGVAALNFTCAQFIIYSKLSCHDLTLTTELVKNQIKDLKLKKSDYDNYYYRLEFNLGLKASESIINIDDEDYLSSFSKLKVRPSTITTFIPDPTIHGTTKSELPVTFRYLKYLHPEFIFMINGKEDKDTPSVYEWEDKVELSYGDTEGEEIKNPWIRFNYSIGLSEELDDYEWDFSVNTLDCQQGKHVRLWNLAMVQAFCDYFDDWEIEKYATMGINVLCIFECCEPSFSSQSKERLSSVENWTPNVAHEVLVKSITKIIKKNKEKWTAHYNRVREYFDSKSNWGKMKELQEALGGLVEGSNKSASAYSPQKLLDCPTKDRSTAELFITEGDSAKGSIVKARAGMDNIAVIGIRGKIKNIVDMDVNEALKNQEIYDIVMCAGGVDDYHADISDLRFGKYIIAADADSDGKQISSLILGCLLSNNKYLFGTKKNKYDDSIVFIARTPLYEVKGVDGDKKKSKYFYLPDLGPVEEFCKKHSYSEIKRYKGLGEVNADDIKKMMLDVETRNLVKVKPDNIEDALCLIGYTDWKHDLMVEKGIISDDTLDLDVDAMLEEIANIENSEA